MCCLQEYADYKPDKYGRFPYAASLQKHFNCIQKNLVAEYFDKLYESTPKLKSLTAKQINKTKFFLTHDIDSLYGGLGDNYKYLLRKGKVSNLLQLIINHYLRTPDYMLLDKIMNIEDEHNVKSTFFWIVNKGIGVSGIRNADYNIQNKKTKALMARIQMRGFTNGLHKSDSKESYSDELNKLGNAALPINRHHFLKITLPETFNAVEKANIRIDSSLGFAEEMGFRNNYGLPYFPYKLKERRSYSFIEIPLTIMDTTFKFYQNKTPLQAQNEIMNFLNANKENAVVTILWHNNYFFDYAENGWMKLYNQILNYIKNGNITAMTPTMLLQPD